MSAKQSEELSVPATLASGRHVYLYAKGAYLRSDLLNDLRRVVAATCLLDPDSVGEDDIYRVCVGVVMDYAFMFHPESGRKELLASFFVDVGKTRLCDDRFHTTGRSPRLALIQESLSVLSTASVLHADGSVFINLGLPDPDVLPLHPNHSLGRDARRVIENAARI